MPDPEKPYSLDDLAEWKKTEAGLDRIKKSPLFEEGDEESPHGYFAGRRIIGRDTEINKGISVGQVNREAIVIDDEKHSSLNEVYEDLFKKRREKLIQEKERTKTGITEVLDTVFNYVLDIMPYNKEKTEEIRKKYPPDKKISLNVFILNKAGVCRHQALLTGYLIERMIKEGLIQGQVRINRNYVKNIGGHTWVKYTDNNGQVYIIDPAQKFCGTLEEAKKKGTWFYEEPKKK